MAEETAPATITIDGREYVLSELSEVARAQITNLRTTDQHIARLQAWLAIAQTARGAYARALAQELGGPAAGGGEGSGAVQTH